MSFSDAINTTIDGVLNTIPLIFLSGKLIKTGKRRDLV